VFIRGQKALSFSPINPFVFPWCLCAFVAKIAVTLVNPPPFSDDLRKFRPKKQHLKNPQKPFKTVQFPLKTIKKP
jgi:hypothetical protein